MSPSAGEEEEFAHLGRYLSAESCAAEAPVLSDRGGRLSEHAGRGRTRERMLAVISSIYSEIA
jgi:hypothetical protein